jgi:hypothetical protein
MQNFKSFLTEEENFLLFPKHVSQEGFLIQSYPSHVSRNFICDVKSLKSLKGCPTIVDGEFNCANSKITSLEYGPIEVGGNYLCWFSKITSLEFAPKKVGGSFDCAGTKITSLKGIGKDYLLEIGDVLNCDTTKITSNILGVLKIKGLKNFRFNSNRDIQDIINKHLSSDRDILECQEELITKGFRYYAKF